MKQTYVCALILYLGADPNEQVKPESMPLSSTYETGQEPAYFPTPYAASRVPGYNRESCGPPGVGNQQNMGTFGSSRSGYTYDIPYPRKVSYVIFFYNVIQFS